MSLRTTYAENVTSLRTSILNHKVEGPLSPMDIPNQYEARSLIRDIDFKARKPWERVKWYTDHNSVQPLTSPRNASSRCGWRVSIPATWKLGHDGDENNSDWGWIVSEWPNTTAELRWHATMKRGSPWMGQSTPILEASDHLALVGLMVSPQPSEKKKSAYPR